MNNQETMPSDKYHVFRLTRPIQYVLFHNGDWIKHIYGLLKCVIQIRDKSSSFQHIIFTVRNIVTLLVF